LSFSLTPKQREIQEIFRGPQRHTLIYGGARSGKTFLTVRAICTRAVMAPGSRHVVLRLRANAARASVGLDTLPKVMRTCFPGVQLVEHRQDGFYEFPNSSQFWIGGLDDKDRVEKILGQEYASMFLNECSQIAYSSVLVARTRLAQVVEFYNPVTKRKEILPQRMYYDLNPVGSKHWSNIEFGLKRSAANDEPLKNPDNYVRVNLNPLDNKQNLSQDTLDELEALPERQRRRFYLGAYTAEIDGALWSPETLARCRCDKDEVPELTRVVVAVDPSGTRGDDDKRTNSVGIVVAGLGIDGKAYVLADLTCSLSPAGWAQIVISAFHKYEADCVVAEENFGGAMVEAVIKGADENVPYKKVSAARGKWVRAEPVSNLYEKEKVRHAGRFPQLEDELENFSTNGYTGEKSPDRADALVWALTDLMLAGQDNLGFLYYLKAQAESAAAARQGKSE
jgi:phage terminase large subunit-like protein